MKTNRDSFLRWVFAINLLTILLAADLAQSVETVISATTLPADGSANVIGLDRFSITASLDLLASSAASTANYVLREAGANGIPGDADDVIYGLSPSFSSGATVNFTIANNPLQPGYYRFQTTTNLLDAASNAVLVFTW